jgi:hypothetical protein
MMTLTAAVRVKATARCRSTKSGGSFARSADPAATCRDVAHGPREVSCAAKKNGRPPDMKP